MTGSSKIPPWLCLYKKRCPLLGLNMVKSFKKLPSPVLPLLHHQCLHLSSSSHRVQLAEVLSTDNILGECMDCIISKNISKETRRYRGDGSTSVTFHGLLFGLGFWKLFSCLFYYDSSSCLLGLPHMISPSRLIPLLIGASSSLCIQILFFWGTKLSPHKVQALHVALRESGISMLGVLVYLSTF